MTVTQNSEVFITPFCAKENATADRARIICGKESQKTIKLN
jgi:hypothetical protein